MTTHPRLTVGDTVIIDAPGGKYHGMIGRLAEDDKSVLLPYFVRFQTGGGRWFSQDQVTRTGPANVLPRLTVGDTVTVDAPGEKYHGTVGTLAEDDGTDLPYFVRFQTGGAEWFTPEQVLRSDLAPADEADTTTTTTTIDTTITIRRPATAAQIADALAHLDLDSEPTLHTYVDRIIIRCTYETEEN